MVFDLKMLTVLQCYILNVYKNVFTKTCGSLTNTYLPIENRVKNPLKLPTQKYLNE